MKIKLQDLASVDAAIKQVVGSAKTHTHTAQVILEDATKLFDKLTGYVHQDSLVGSEFKLSSQPVLPPSYGKFDVIYTEVLVEVCRDGLYLTHIKRIQGSSATTPKTNNYAILPNPIKEFIKNKLYYNIITL